MTVHGVKQKSTNRHTYEKLDDFRIILGHVGIPHELFRSPKGKLYIRFDRPMEGDSVALQYRNAYTAYATGHIRPAHYRMFVGVFDSAIRQEVLIFQDMNDLVRSLGISQESILAGADARRHLKRRLQAMSVGERSDPATRPLPPFLLRPLASPFG